MKIILANFCVCSSLYVFLPATAVGAWQACGDGTGGAGLSALFFVAGMCLPAPFCNYWLDAYRRKSVALWTMAVLVCATAALFFAHTGWGVCLARVGQGASYGVFQIAVGSTLLLDLSDTKKRTEAAHVYYWFSRLALVAGPVAGIVVPAHYGLRFLGVVSLVLLLCAVLCIASLRVPFRAPLEPAFCAFDRFWLPRGWRLFIPLFGTCFAAGWVLGEVGDTVFYLWFAVGLWLSLWLHHSLFRERLQLEIAVGFLALMACPPFLSSGGMAAWGAALCLGGGLGLVASRYLLSYIRICAHCERGTAQTSYLLGWDAGLLAGFALAAVPGVGGPGASSYTYYIIGAVVATMALFHLCVVRGWYARHKRK